MHTNNADTNYLTTPGIQAQAHDGDNQAKCTVSITTN